MASSQAPVDLTRSESDIDLTRTSDSDSDGDSDSDSVFFVSSCSDDEDGVVPAAAEAAKAAEDAAAQAARAANAAKNAARLLQTNVTKAALVQAARASNAAANAATNAARTSETNVLKAVLVRAARTSNAAANAAANAARISEINVTKAALEQAVRRAKAATTAAAKAATKAAANATRAARMASVRAKRSGSWTADETKLLQKYSDAGRSPQDIADLLKKKKSQVAAKTVEWLKQRSTAPREIRVVSTPPQQTTQKNTLQPHVGKAFNANQSKFDEHDKAHKPLKRNGPHETSDDGGARQVQSFDVGDLVDVQAVTTSGKNQLGGAARITNKHVHDDGTVTFDVQFTIERGTLRNVSPNLLSHSTVLDPRATKRTRRTRRYEGSGSADSARARALPNPQPTQLEDKVASMLIEFIESNHCTPVRGLFGFFSVVRATDGYGYDIICTGKHVNATCTVYETPLRCQIWNVSVQRNPGTELALPLRKIFFIFVYATSKYAEVNKQRSFEVFLNDLASPSGKQYEDGSNLIRYSILTWLDQGCSYYETFNLQLTGWQMQTHAEWPIRKGFEEPFKTKAAAYAHTIEPPNRFNYTLLPARGWLKRARKEDPNPTVNMLDRRNTLQLQDMYHDVASYLRHAPIDCKSTEPIQVTWTFTRQPRAAGSASSSASVLLARLRL